jgi:hypothetical protein
MPDGEDDRLIPNQGDDAVRIFDLQSKRARPEPVQPKAKDDQKARAPAIELHFGAVFAASSRQR